MAENPIMDKTAIVGIGWTPFTRRSGASTAALAAQASLMAIEDAGLRVEDIDGVVGFFHQQSTTISPRELVEMLGIPHCDFYFFQDGGGTWNAGAMLAAAMMVHSGVCKNVLVYNANNQYSEWRPARADRAKNVSGFEQFRTPFGDHHAAAHFGMYATEHMARYGTTTLDFAHLAVTQRKHATLNEKAQMRKPITIEDHQNSRWIIYPYRLFDCCQETDGAVALVVTSAEQARDLRHNPVYVMAGIGRLAEREAGNRREVFDAAGITPKDVSIAEVYDNFTFMCMKHLEDFGFVPEGESGAWVRAGHNGLDGDLPVNTHGGLLSEAHFMGLNHVVEAVQQLRTEGVVDDLCEGRTHTTARSAGKCATRRSRSCAEYSAGAHCS